MKEMRNRPANKKHHERADSSMASRQNGFEKITAVFLYSMITIYLLYWGDNGYTTISQAKYRLFLLLCGGYVFVMLLFWLEHKIVTETLFIGTKNPWKKLKIAQKMVVLYMGITWVSAFVSPQYPTTVLGAARHEGAVSISLYGICFLLVSFYGKVTRRLMYVFAGAVSLFAVLCIIQLYGGNPFHLYPLDYTYYNAYVDYAGAFLGTIGNVDHVGAFLCIAIPILGLTIFRCQGKERFFLLLPLGLLLFVLIKMWVLASIVGVAIGTAMAIPVAFPLQRKTRRIYLLALIGMTLFSGSLLYFVDVGAGFFHEIHELLHGRIDDSFGTGRIYIWKNVLQRIPEHLLLGAGPDTLRYAGIEPFSRFDETYQMWIQSTIDTAHNEYLNILYHQGIFALLAFLVALGETVVAYIRTGIGEKVQAVFVGAVLCYGVQAFFGIGSCITEIYFWVSLGLLCGSNGITPMDTKLRK